jgi:hypothetical protein
MGYRLRLPPLAFIIPFVVPVGVEEDIQSVIYVG